MICILEDRVLENAVETDHLRMFFDKSGASAVLVDVEHDRKHAVPARMISTKLSSVPLMLTEIVPHVGDLRIAGEVSAEARLGEIRCPRFGGAHEHLLVSAHGGAIEG